MSKKSRYEKDINRAIERGDIEAVKELVKNPQNLACDPSLYSEASPLHVAALSVILRENGEDTMLEIISILVDAGADLNGQDKRCWIPLISAVQGSSVKIVNYLIEMGSDVNHFAQTEGEKSYGGGITPLQSAAKYSSNSDIVESLLKAGADTEVSSFPGGTALLDCLGLSFNDAMGRPKRTEFVKHLLDYGANANATNRYGENAFHVLANGGYTPEIANMLLERGVPLNRRAGIYRETPLSLAARNNNVEFAKFLIENGANPLLRNSDGKLPSEVCEDAFRDYSDPDSFIGRFTKASEGMRGIERDSNQADYLYNLLLKAEAEARSKTVIGRLKRAFGK